MPKRIKKEPGTPQERADSLRCELQVYGFAVAKELSKIAAEGEVEGVVLTSEGAGYMNCPMCGSKLRFSTALSNDHFRAHCSREGCLRIIE